MIKVTIGIPVYNSEKYLRDAIQSVLNQTYADFELILLNDGSTDNSLDIIKGFEKNDSRVRVIDDGENKGLIFRLNQLIGLAGGKYFARMDADDIMFPDRIEKQLMLLEKNPYADVTHSDAVSIDDENNILGYKMSSVIKTSRDTLDEKVPIHPTVFAKTKWFKKHMYLDDYVRVEDFELWNRSINDSLFLNITEPLLFYRELSTNNSNKFLMSLPGKKKFAKVYGLSFSDRFKIVYLNYFKFIYCRILEIFRLDYLSVRHRFKGVEPKRKVIYQDILNSVKADK
ncbi:glycosyltransferase family 2 protein [Flavobacterium sp. H122]|uniref:glycosyltransferase family 2 protein n=1 Tax=Flavobacterium sp. H122 TaxID=2529860 RepID=UPI0010A9C402|nr:glycosyltransferase family 2 protein [Flavobacterium sp. H122]